MGRRIGPLSIFWAVVVVAPALGAKDRVFEFVPTTAQAIEYVQGQQVALQEGALSAVAVRFVPYDRKRAWIEVTIENRGSDSVLVKETSLQASAGGDSLTVYTYDDLLRSQNRAEAWRAAAAGMAAAGNSMSAANAGYSHTYGTYNERTNANVYGSGGGYAYGSATTNGTYSSTTYNAAEAAAAQNAANERNRQLMADMNAANQRDRGSLDARALRVNTLRAQAVITGQIMIDLPRKTRDAAPLQLSFAVGEETYRFSLIELSTKR